MIKFIVSPWKNKFVDIIKETKGELFLSSPFINEGGIGFLSNLVSNTHDIELSVITNLTLRNVENRGVNPSALLGLWSKFKRVQMSSLGKLHAKVYLIDDKIGVVTSANLTRSGLSGNFEYGVLIKDKDYIREIKEDMEKYFSFGNIFSKEALTRVANKSRRIWKIKEEINKEIKKSKRLQEFKKERKELETELFKNRIKEGKTINGIFADTILYLLEKKGALTTEELHPLVQAIHPDICDDSIDRVIEGEHFGKKWKHQVRSAQQFLKRKGQIELKKGKWYLIGKREGGK